MQNILKVSVVALAMVATGMTVSYAQQAEGPDMAEMNDGGHGGKHHGGRHHGGKRGMQMIDANMDGVVNDEEAAALADHMFARLDADGNDALSEAEFTAPRGRHGGKRGWFGWGQEEAAAVTEVRKQKFATLDADKNGAVSKAEFFADAKARLAAADTDKDGKVTPWEFRASPKL